MSNKQTHFSPTRRNTQATMKTYVSSSSSTTTTSSSVRSSTTTAMEDDRSENRDSSCYYPGCRKDANCNCDMCLASINATLDLMPFSIQKSSLTKFSASRPKLNPRVELTPISFDASVLSTPTSSSPQIPVSPDLKFPARLKSKEKTTRKGERKWGFGFGCCRLILGLSLVYVAVCGFSKLISGALKPVLSPGMVRNVGEKSWVVDDLNGRLRFLQKEVRDLVQGRVSNCSFPNSIWEISQDGMLLNSHCTLYKSAMEEVTIWGWPLQTAGLLTSGFSSRSFTILSGRVTEWSDGTVGYVIRKSNTSWVQRNWGASAVQLDPNTWILEYRRSSPFENQRLVSAALTVLKNRMSRMLGKMHKFWLLSAFGNNQYLEATARYNIKIPT